MRELAYMRDKLYNEIKNKRKNKEFCTFCNKEYKPKSYMIIFGMALADNHNCKEEKKYYKAVKKLHGIN